MAIQDFSKTALAELVSLKGRTAVVTGGARGIGLAIAKRLAEAGANIVIADIDVGDCLKQAMAELKKFNPKAMDYRLDTRSADDMERAAESAIEQFGRLDIWVNDAGIYPQKEFLELEDQLLDEVLDINVKGVVHGSQSAARRMKKGGVILNLASVAGFRGSSEMVHYNASKFAVRGLTAGLAKEFGKQHIRVVAVAPTLVDTPGVHETFPDIKKEIKETAEHLPLGRVALPDDIARAALFLVSDLAAFVTGTTLVIDGGNLVLG